VEPSKPTQLTQPGVQGKEPNMFKPGDKVRCVDDDGQETELTKNKVYEITKVDQDFVKIVSNSVLCWFRPVRFELVSDKAEFKPGDKVRFIGPEAGRSGKDKIYTVKKWHKDYENLIILEENIESTGGWHKDRFELVSKSANVQSLLSNTRLKTIVEPNKQNPVTQVLIDIF